MSSELPVWHLLQVSDVLDLELASALAASVPVVAWEPQRALPGGRPRPGGETERLSNEGERGGMLDSATTFRIRSLPLLRGFARPPVSWIARTGPDVLSRLLAQTPDPARSPLVCSTPYFAAVAERWPGPVVYWLTDLIAEYSSASRRHVHALDRRMCRRSTLVCPNSTRLRDYLCHTAACDPAKIHIVPNATRRANVLAAPPTGPAPLPPSLEHLRRPIAGVIGNLAGNMDWLLIREMVAATPWLQWVFVGSTAMHIADRRAREARTAVLAADNTLFTGRQPYGALAGFARSFDVAILPYRRCEPTYSGSSTRFYEHLAACRPMLSTRGLEELAHKTPLLTLFDTPAEGLAALDALRAQGFDDGLLSLRWRTSLQNTWTTRAESIREALAARLATHQPVPAAVPHSSRLSR